MSSLKKKLGVRIQEIRKSKNMTQEKLAEVIGLNVPNLSNIERGKKFVSAETLEKIIKALNINESELFDFDHIKSRDELLNLIKIVCNFQFKQTIYNLYHLISYSNLLKRMIC